MSNSAMHQAALYNTESAWGENTKTFGTRMLPVAAVDVSGLTQEMVRIPIMKQRPHEEIEGVRGVYGGSFNMSLLLTGHGGTAAGALTATDLYTLLKHVIGGGNAANVGTTATGGTASVPTLAAGTFANGSMCRIGALGDGRAEGQFYAVDNLSGSNLTLLNDAAGAPNSGDVVAGSQVIYPSETPGTIETVQSLRFRLQTANGQYDCHGCFPTAVTFNSTGFGEVPTVDITFGVSWWEPANATFPSATATDAKSGRPVANGSLHISDVATTTRSAYSYRSWSISIDMDVRPITGPGGVTDRQTVIGAKRHKCGASISFTLDKEAAGTDSFYDEWATVSSSRASKLIVLSLTVQDGGAIGFAFPQARMDDSAPVQIDDDGINRETIKYIATTGPTLTTDLEAAAWKLAMG